MMDLLDVYSVRDELVTRFFLFFLINELVKLTRLIEEKEDLSLLRENESTPIHE